MEADGLLATCIQHEMDHLEGILFVDHLEALKRNIILRKLLKAKKSAPARLGQELMTIAQADLHGHARIARRWP